MMLRIHIGLGLRWTCWDVGLIRGREGGWCWEERCAVKVSCRLPRGAFLQLMCSQNTWWKVKVQWGLSIFTRIMLYPLYCFPHSSYPPLFYLFFALPSGHSCEDRSGEFSHTSDPGQVHCAAITLSVHSHLTLKCESCSPAKELNTNNVFLSWYDDADHIISYYKWW